MKESLPILLMQKIMRVNRLHRSLINMQFADPAAHRTQHLILRYLTWSGTPLSQKNLAEKFEVSSPAMAVTLKKLENSGMVTRIESPEDARIKLVSITPQGTEAVLSQRQFFSSLNSSMIRDIAPADLETACRVLDQMADNLLRAGAADQAKPVSALREMQEHPREGE